MTLEQAFAEWSSESLTMAQQMWHHGAIDTAVNDPATVKEPQP